jgi:hypothetical protein
MPASEYKQGSVLYAEGDSLSCLSFITNGSVEACFSGHPFRFEKGDMIGLCDLAAGSHSHTYTAATDVSVFSYPYECIDSLEALLRGNADAANLLVNSMSRQIADFLYYKSALKREADSAYDSLMDIYPQYETLCKQYAFSSKKLPDMETLQRCMETEPAESWVHNYYTEIKGLSPAARNAFFHGKPGISTGFIRRSAEDIILVIKACKEYREYLKNISSIFLNEGEHDLFALIAGLHTGSVGIKGADAAVDLLMTQLTGLLHNMTGVDSSHYLKRLNSYKDALLVNRTTAEVAEGPAAPGVKQNLSDSLDVIFDYSECPGEKRSKFARLVQDFIKMPDRGISDDAGRKLRKELTTLYQDIYKDSLIKSIKDPAPPTIVKMFLNFGYVDATLAGAENADFLYSIADSLKGDPALGVYTAREWMTMIYTGKKEPNRNEFDMDYYESLRELKTRGEIDAPEESRRSKDPEAKLRFELDNVFPIVNKLTFGRITTYCPLFSDQNVQRKLTASIVTPALLREALDDIRRIDFSAYCREILYSNPAVGITNENINIEALPDIILMPNVGVRGVMWQEIEGRKRGTPARMFLPMFLEPDLKPLLMRLTAEFRWEMCKRIQGIRWNDVTNPSLTSEFSDYLQFYKNNRELSVETKETIKNELTRAKNNYKTVFVQNYAEWLQYESNGSPRLNKNVLRMMMLYCPFSAPIREKLTQHPRYAQLLTQFNNKQKQKINRLNNVMQKVKQAGHPVPKELLDEMGFSSK